WSHARISKNSLLLPHFKRSKFELKRNVYSSIRRLRVKPGKVSQSGAIDARMLLTLFMSALQTPKARRERGVSEMFRALRHRNFRLFWSGAFLSNTGTWMQAVAQGWLVLQLSNSPFWLGVDGFMATAPGLVLTLAGGVFADLFDRRKLLIYTQT